MFESGKEFRWSRSIKHNPYVGTKFHAKPRARTDVNSAMFEESLKKNPNVGAFRHSPPCITLKKKKGEGLRDLLFDDWVCKGYVITQQSLSREAKNAKLRCKILKVLPLHTKADDDNDKECSICLSQFYKGESIRYLNCGHNFHKDCLDPWLCGIFADDFGGELELSCPCCRTPISVEEVKVDEAASSPTEPDAELDASHQEITNAPIDPDFCDQFLIPNESFVLLGMWMSPTATLSSRSSSPTCGPALLAQDERERSPLDGSDYSIVERFSGKVV